MVKLLTLSKALQIGVTLSVAVVNGQIDTTVEWNVKELSYENEIEKAGSIFADVVSVLSLTKDILKASQSIRAVHSVLARFSKATATIGETEGIILKAQEGKNTIQIFCDSGDGNPQLMHTDSDVAAIEQSIEKSGLIATGFGNCQVCIESGGAILRRQKGPFRKLCCLLNPQTIEAREPVLNDDDTAGLTRPAAVPLDQRVVGTLFENRALTTDEKKLTAIMSDGFTNWYTKDIPVLYGVDDVTKVLLLAKKDLRNRPMIARAVRQLYGIDEKFSALVSWVQYYYVNLEINSVLRKLPPSTGLAIRSTALDAETLDMLNHWKRGRFSEGEPGIYEVRAKSSRPRATLDEVEKELADYGVIMPTQSSIWHGDGFLDFAERKAEGYVRKRQPSDVRRRVARTF
ncbi:hypothetical protein LZ30DRAFT_690093 [Colletotrichum cereale]|nr:hypothetical protein LZ30DRAFT_690093 [Colletotrichum cereale]